MPLAMATGIKKVEMMHRSNLNALKFPFLFYNEVKWLNFSFCGGQEHMMAMFELSCPIWTPLIQV